MTLLGMLKFLFWIINHYLILVIAKILYLVLGEGSTNNINDNIGAIKKRFCINFSKTIFFFFCITLHYNHDNNYLLVNGKEIYTFKADNKNVSIST